MSGLGRNLLLAARLPDPEPATDGQLLERFLSGRDEPAFAELVARHGRMVLAVCRRVLGDAHEAEDAFQVAFLVLARKGRSLTGRASVGAWLYQAACLTARKARAQAVKRRTREAAAARAEPVAPAPNSPDWLAILDMELSRLPAKYRDPVVLCELEGKTREEVAALLGIPVGTLSSRLATAHRLLADRLRRRGVTAPAVLAAAAAPAPAAVPPALAESAVRAAAVVAGLATGTVPAAVHTLLAEVTRAMSLKKFVVWGGAVAAVVAAGGLAWAGLAGGDVPPTAGPPAPAKAVVSPAAKPPAKAEEPDGEPDEKEEGVGPPKPGEPAWKAEFRKVYGLADGQAMKLVPGDPFPSCRDAYLDEFDGLGKNDRDKSLITFVAGGGRIAYRTGILGAYGWQKEQTRNGIEARLRGRQLWEVLDGGFRIAAPLLEADDELATTELYADLVVREKAPWDQVAKSLEAELGEKFQIAVAAAAREEEREVVVARGKYVHKPREAKVNGVISLAARDLDPDDFRGTYSMLGSDPAGLFRSLGAHIGRPVIDETDQASWKLKVRKGKESDIGAWTGLRGYRYPRRSREDVRPVDGSAGRDAVLKHVAEQTGVTFATEKRKVWVLSVKKAEK